MHRRHSHPIYKSLADFALHPMLIWFLVTISFEDPIQTSALPHQIMTKVGYLRGKMSPGYLRLCSPTGCRGFGSWRSLAVTARSFEFLTTRPFTYGEIRD